MKKNTYLYVFIGIITVFTIGYFIAANSISYAFVNPYEEDSYIYNQKINEIKIAATKYIKNHQDLLKKEDNVYIIVDDLVKESLLDADSDGKVKDPTNSFKNLNNIKIRISKSDNGYDIKVLS